MSNLDTLKRKVSELEVLALEIEDLGTKLLLNAQLSYRHDIDSYDWVPITDELRPTQRDANRKYQRWFNSAHQLIKDYVPDREEEFVECYLDKKNSLGVLDQLLLSSDWWIKAGIPKTKYFLEKFEIQRSILLSIPDVAELKELNLRQLISADVARTEIEQAEILLASGFERAAGSIAGVALELYLKTLCNIKGVSYAPKATIDPLAQALYNAGKFDITELKQMQYLASIRNKCSHPNPVSESEIRSLVEGVKKLI